MGIPRGPGGDCLEVEYGRRIAKAAKAAIPILATKNAVYSSFMVSPLIESMFFCDRYKMELPLDVRALSILRGPSYLLFTLPCCYHI